jgi:hypothetical protein
MSYPDKIIILRDTPEFDLLYKHSELFRVIVEHYAEDKNRIVLSSDFFGGNGEEWFMFIDLFFPEMGVSPLFTFKNRSIQLNPYRGTKEKMTRLLRYMMVNNDDTMMNFARNQARKQVNMPRNTVPRGTGVRKTQKYARYNSNQNYNNNNNNNNSNNYNNNNNSNNSGPPLGYTENEERYLGKLSNRNAKVYFANRGGKRKTRKSRKN